MADDGKVSIDVRWPAAAIRDDWRIKEVVAIDVNGVAHMVEIIGCSREVVLKRRKKH